MKTMNEDYVLVPRNVLVPCINTLKMIHPTDFDGMDKLVAVVATLQEAMAKGVQHGNAPAEMQPGDDQEALKIIPVQVEEEK